jgi:trans-aconitate 2-methyltransferase
MAWDPDLYHRFQAQRAAPFADALSLVKRRPRLRVIDLGCGTGELTRRLADALPDSDVVGLDASPEMLERAALEVRPGLRFVAGHIEALNGLYDLIFSHAALHWVEDHERFLPRLYALLAPGGQLVAQIPSNPDHSSRTLMAELAKEPPFAETLGSVRGGLSLLTTERYAELFFRLGAADFTVYEKVYPHVYSDAEGIVEFYRSTALKPYLEPLSEPLRGQFLDRYRERLRACFPERPVFLGFRRILFQATKPA